MPKQKVLILNGALGGAAGNTAELVKHFVKHLPDDAVAEVVHLKDEPELSVLGDKMRAADALVLATGTYWQSWGSPMQRFFEEVTASDWEATDAWVGKPTAVLVTMHSVGGNEVMSRVMGNVVMMGGHVPPFCCFVYSSVVHSLIEAGRADTKDIWELHELRTPAENLMRAAANKVDYDVWDIDEGERVTDLWLKNQTAPKRRWNVLGRFFNRARAE